VLLRRCKSLLAITVLSYETQLKKPAEFEGEVPDVATGSAEVKLARTLIEASTAEEFDFGKYQDEHTDDLRKLIESKAHGKKIVAGREGAAPAIINLMDALRESLQRRREWPGHPCPAKWKRACPTPARQGAPHPPAAESRMTEPTHEPHHVPEETELRPHRRTARRQGRRDGASASSFKSTRPAGCITTSDYKSAMSSKVGPFLKVHRSTRPTGGWRSWWKITRSTTAPLRA